MAEQPSAPAELAAPKKNKTKLLLLILIPLLLVISLGAAAAWFFLLNKEPGDETAKPAQASAAVPQARQKAVYQLLDGAFVITLNADGRNRYMQVSVALMARDEDALKELMVHRAVLRNQLVMLFSGQDFSDLREPMAIDLLKQKATAVAQEVAMREVGSSVVEQVLFTNFVMQ